MSSEDELILFEDGSDQKKLRVILKKFNNIPLLDLRYWYLDKKTQETKPGRQGISLTRVNYLGMRSIAVDHHETVMEYLNVGSITPTHNGDGSLIAEHNLRIQQPVSKLKTIIKPIRPVSRLYEVNHQGGEAIVYINQHHPFAEDLVTGKISESELNIFGKMLLAIDLSLMNSKGNELTSPRIISEQFEFDFSNYAKQLSRID